VAAPGVSPPPLALSGGGPTARQRQATAPSLVDVTNKILDTANGHSEDRRPMRVFVSWSGCRSNIPAGVRWVSTLSVLVACATAGTPPAGAQRTGVQIPGGT
jgi:hypothetical protein